MNKLFRILTAALCCSAITNATAQLVYVPDLDLRTYLDSVLPGVVDANGYIDSSGPQAQSMQYLTIGGNWSVMDLTGVEAFVNLYQLQVLNPVDAGYVDTLTITALPPNLQQLVIHNDFSLSSLPQLPSALELLSLQDITDLTALPPLPSGLTELRLEYLPDLTSIPALPTTMEYLGIRGCPDLVSLPQFPNEVGTLELMELELPSLPALPTIVSYQLLLGHMLLLTQLPAMPYKVGDKLDLSYLPLVDTISSLPDSCHWVQLHYMPSACAIMDWPEDLTELWLIDGGPSCLPPLPASLEMIYSGQSLVTCYPPLPANTLGISWDGQWVPANEVPVCNVLNSTCDPLACGIEGRVFVDADADGVYDQGETLLANATLQATPGNWITASAHDGMYNIGVQTGTYSVACTPDHPYVQSVAPATHSAVFSQLSEVDTLNDFAVTLIPNVQDLVVDVMAPSPPVPGFIASYAISYQNRGTQWQDGTVSFSFDPVLAFSNSVPPPTTTLGNTLSWDFTQLAAGASEMIIVHLSTPIGAIIGTPLTSSALADPLATDQTPGDNAVSFVNEVRSSYDPNDKTVEPTELTTAEVAAGERVNYTVRFQNTGTFQATRVIVTDTLSSDLQWSTMQLVAASHAQNWYIHDGVLYVIFDNINLPDSNANEPASHGFVKFSMKPVSTLMLGASVSNTANIYFDFNEPVITNAAVFTVDDEQSVAETSTETLILSPNPVNDVLYIALDKSAANLPLSVVDLTGRVVLTGSMNGPRAQLNVQALKAGSYQLRMGERMVGRFVKR
ncbi:MAG: T9SS type A sorting domain-containing protein [Flavobacteriales bacterium]